MDKHAQLLEAILFMRGEEVSRRELLGMLSIDDTSLRRTTEDLRTHLEGHGIAIIETTDVLALVTAPDVGEFMKDIREEELSGPLSRGAMETLTIILYRTPVTKVQIDYLRGVNSATMLRNLLVRGLIERSEEQKGRSFLYKPTVTLLSVLGVTKNEDLPDYNELRMSIDRVSNEITHDDVS